VTTVTQINYTELVVDSTKYPFVITVKSPIPQQQQLIRSTSIMPGTVA